MLYDICSFSVEHLVNSNVARITQLTFMIQFDCFCSLHWFFVLFVLKFLCNYFCAHAYILLHFNYIFKINDESMNRYKILWIL